MTTTEEIPVAENEAATPVGPTIVPHALSNYIQPDRSKQGFMTLLEGLFASFRGDGIFETWAVANNWHYISPNMEERNAARQITPEFRISSAAPRLEVPSGELSSANDTPQPLRSATADFGNARGDAYADPAAPPPDNPQYRQQAPAPGIAPG